MEDALGVVLQLGLAGFEALVGVGGRGAPSTSRSGTSRCQRRSRSRLCSSRPAPPCDEILLLTDPERGPDLTPIFTPKPGTGHAEPGPSARRSGGRSGRVREEIGPQGRRLGRAELKVVTGLDPETELQAACSTRPMAGR